MRRGGFVLVLGLVLAACVPPGPPTPAVTVTPTAIVTPTPTLVPAPTRTVSPVPTPMEEPSMFATVALKLVADTFTAPVGMAMPDDGSGRIFIVDQIGLIYVLDAGGDLMPEPFLDLRDRMVTLRPNYDERGLLGLAFHPAYAENGRFFVYYSAPLRPEAPAGWNCTSHISEFAVSADDPDQADPDSEQILLQVDKPQGNHNGGELEFGPDGYLYIAIGDGGGANDSGAGHVPDWYEVNEGGNGQDITANLLGNILRIDVDGAKPYAIPADNPFAGEAVVGLDEIWAYGFRNPYGVAFDPGGDRELFAGDAGQNLWEEVDLVTRGGNYGWNVREGMHCFSTAHPDVPLDSCPSVDPEGRPLIDPIIEFPNAEQPNGLGEVVVGGVVYRGAVLSGWDGYYIFGQWSRGDEPSGGLFLATRPRVPGAVWPFLPIRIQDRENGELGEYLRGFGQDLDGEVYLLTSEIGGPTGQTGKVYRIGPAGP